MRLYSGSSQQFLYDTDVNQITEKLRISFFEQIGFNPSPAEQNSWRNSLRAMAGVIRHADLKDHGIILEYQLPLTSKRLDCLISGLDINDKPNAVIVELKQWEKCSDALGENEVLTWLGGSQREVLHPSVQVGRYKMYLEDSHTAFYEDPGHVYLNACSYLHNYSYKSNDPLLASKFLQKIEAFPVFSQDEVFKFKDFLQPKLKVGRGLEVLQVIEQSKYRPSKKLMDHVGNMIRGKAEYVLLDEQLVVYDKVLSSVKQSFHQKDKVIILVKGGPGTGKSVIAINLMADLLLKGYNAHYATGSRAFTETLRRIIGTRGASQFKYFNSYMNSDFNVVDVLICDEAHRLREFSHNRFTPKENRTGTPQIRELIKASKVCVFFIDDYQMVRPGEIGSGSYIKKNATEQGTPLFEYELEAQFRCSGSDAFVNWINHTLDISRTANAIWTGDENFEFRLIESPEALEQTIRQKTIEGDSARVVAGFCWPWSKKPNSDGTLDDDVVIGDFRRPWNARPEATRLAQGIPKATLWAYDPNGINQIGCIYTAQGFEFDYVGVIFGRDLIYNLDTQQWEGHRGNSFDAVVKKSGKQFLDLVKNTYRVLLSRGLKGCYVHFMDKDTERFFKSRMDARLLTERGFSNK